MRARAHAPGINPLRSAVGTSALLSPNAPVEMRVIAVKGARIGRGISIATACHVKLSRSQHVTLQSECVFLQRDGMRMDRHGR